MMSDILSNSLVWTGGTSLLMGGMVGFAVKKTIKILAFIGGLGIIVLAVLEHYQLINVNWERVKESTNSTAHYLAGQTDTIVHQIAGHVDGSGYPVMFGGFIGGFLIGLRAG